MRVGGEPSRNLKPGTTFEVPLKYRVNVWAVPLEEIYINGKHMDKSRGLDTVEIDPTYRLVSFPLDEYEKLCEEIKRADHRFQRKLDRHCHDKVHGQCSAELPTFQLQVRGG